MSTNTRTTVMNEAANLEKSDTPLWKAILVFGVVMAALGCAAMSLPWVTAIAIELLLGVTLLLAGVMQGVYAYQSRREPGLGLVAVSAVLFTVAGLFLLASPVAGVASISLMLAILFVTEGVSKTLWAIRLPVPFNRALLMIEGVAGIVLGLFFYVNWPSDAAWMIGLLVGIRLLLAGFGSIAIGWAMRPDTQSDA